MPTTPFESITLDHLQNVTGGCKKKSPPPPPPAAEPDPGVSIATNVSISGFGQPAQTQSIG